MVQIRQEEERDRPVLTLKGGGLTLFLILFMIQFSYAGPTIVDKQAGPEKVLKKGEKIEVSAEKKEEKIEEQYVYSPVGKTDPFVSFLPSGKGTRGATTGGKDSKRQEGEGEILKEGPKTELQKIEIYNLALTAVIKGEGKNWAMVKDPKGQGYFLKKGTKIGTGHGEVDKIICMEKETPFGMESVRKVVIKEPYLNRDRNIEYRYVEMEMPNATK